MQAKHEVSILETQKGCLKDFIHAIEEAEGHLAKQKGLIEKGISLLQATSAELADVKEGQEPDDGSSLSEAKVLSEADYKSMSFDQIYKVGLLPDWPRLLGLYMLRCPFA